MLSKFNIWRRKRRFVKAYAILRDEAEHHIAAGHLMEFKAVSDSNILLRCSGCPRHFPPKLTRKERKWKENQNVG